MARSQQPDSSALEVGKGRILLVLPFSNLTDPNGHTADAHTADAHATDAHAATTGAAKPAGTAAKSTPNGSEHAPNEPVGNDHVAVNHVSTNHVATEHVNDQVNLDWLREAAPEILNSRFTSAGFLPLSREDRLYALDHLGLPEGFQPSRATTIRLAQTLDADYILIGSYRANGSALVLKARVVDVAKLKISDEVTESGPIAQLIPLLNSLAWKLTRMLDPSFGVAEETFRAAGSNVHVDAFEQYIRGLTEHDPAERLRHLKKATDLNPGFTEAWLATGRLQYQNQQYDEAAVSFGKVTRGDPSELDAGFYRGLALMFTGNYPKAEDAFAAVARVLPLPEVVNNEAVAISRRGHDGVALFRQSAAADPNDADYHFNLAVSLHTHGDHAEALKEIAQTLKLHPNDSEAKATQEAWKKGPVVVAALDKTQAGSGEAGSTPAGSAQAGNTQAGSEQESHVEPGVNSVEPLERIKRSYNGAAFRQAAMMLDEVEQGRLAALPKAERAARLSKSAHEKLDRGLLLEAEREYQAALSADDHSAEAHAGLAEVRERAGDTDRARQEAHAAIGLKPNLEAYLVLARLDLAANHLTEARDEAGEAVKLDGSSRTAKDLRKAIDARIESRPAS